MIIYEDGAEMERQDSYSLGIFLDLINFFENSI